VRQLAAEFFEGDFIVIDDLEESVSIGDVKMRPDPVRNGARNGRRKSELLPLGR
jgi:hypothetical protein